MELSTCLTPSNVAAAAAFIVLVIWAALFVGSILGNREMDKLFNKEDSNE